MKTVLFLPGFRSTPEQKKFDDVLTAIESKGFAARIVFINWHRTLPNDWVAQLDAIYSQYDPSDVILAGFSYGATTAFLSAAKRNPSQLWLFSFSPYFSDDMPHMKKSWLANIGHRRADYFRQLEFEPLARQIACPTLLMAGELESKKYPLIGRRARIAYDKIKNSRLVWVTGTNHEITNHRYIEAIKANI